MKLDELDKNPKRKNDEDDESNFKGSSAIPKNRMEDDEAKVKFVSMID